MELWLAFGEWKSQLPAVHNFGLPAIYIQRNQTIPLRLLWKKWLSSLNHWPQSEKVSYWSPPPPNFGSNCHWWSIELENGVSIHELQREIFHSSIFGISLFSGTFYICHFYTFYYVPESYHRIPHQNFVLLFFNWPRDNDTVKAAVGLCKLT